MERSKVAKTHYKSAAVLISLFFALMCFFGVFGSIAAKAENDGDQTKTIYYFSDYAGSAKIALALKYAFGADNVKYDYLKSITAEKFLEDFMRDNKFDVFQATDAYIILEVRSRFSPEAEDVAAKNGKLFVPTALKEIFSGFKANHCTTIFINGTDESQFVKYNDLFDYVDFQINTDLLFTFEENIMYNVARKCFSKRIENCTFLFDYGIVPGYDIDYKRNSRFITNYFMIYMKKVYMSELYYGQKYNTVGEIMSDKYIYTLAQLTGNDYINLNTGGELNLLSADQYPEFYGDLKLTAIGNNEYQVFVEAEEWIRGVEGCFQMLNVDYSDDNGVGIFIYDGANYGLPEYSHEGVFRITDVDDADVIAALIEFIQSGDAGEYNNWSGKSGATFKPLSDGQGGWIIYMRDDSGYDPYVVDLPLFLETEKEYVYFYGTANNW